MQRRKDEGSFLTKYIRSFKHSVDGIVYSIEEEINIVLIMILSIIALVVGFLLNISTVELCLIVISMGALMASELINCAIEATIDLITLDINPLAKIAKDCGSAASFVMSLVAIAICMFVFGPYFAQLF